MEKKALNNTLRNILKAFMFAPAVALIPTMGRTALPVTASARYNAIIRLRASMPYSLSAVEFHLACRVGS